MADGWLFRDEVNFNKHKDLIREYFTPDQEIINTINQLISECKKKSDVIIGIHIRRGDYINIPEYGILSLEYFARNLNDVGKEDDEVIVASDDLGVLHDFLSLRDVEILSPKDYSPLETMRRLTASKVFIMSNSTFSFWVGWLVSLKGGIVIRPNPWFKQSNVSENFLSLNKFLDSPSEFEIM